jgi:hypothetical protein
MLAEKQLCVQSFFQQANLLAQSTWRHKEFFSGELKATSLCCSVKVK